MPRSRKSKIQPKCANCKERVGTEQWGDFRYTVLWCMWCVLDAQIAHAQERMAALPELLRRRAALDE